MAAPQLNRAGGSGRARDSSRAARPRRTRAATAILILVAYFTGCLRYVPADFETVPLGADVMVAISDPRDPALRELVGPGAELVDGRLLRRNETELVLLVSAVQYEGLEQPVEWPEREPVAIARELVGAIQERQIDRTRSWIAAGLAVLGVVLATTVIVIEGGGTEIENGKPTPGPDPDQ